MRAISFLVGMGLVGVVALAATPEQARRDPRLKSEACKRDNIAPRACPRFEADHIIPLFFEHYFRVNLDILSNIQLQPWPAAKRKDAIELEVYNAIREGRMTPQAGWSVFADHRGGW